MTRVTLVLNHISAKGAVTKDEREPARRDLVPRGANQAPSGSYKSPQKTNHRYGS